MNIFYRRILKIIIIIIIIIITKAIGSTALAIPHYIG
jgi:hypothetical protein